MNGTQDDLYEMVEYPQSRVVDTRGVIENILSGVNLNHVAIITSKKGSVRANHFHPTSGQDQWMYLISGMYKSVSVPVDSAGTWLAPVKSFVVRPGGLTHVGPLVGHAYEFLEDSVFLNLSAVTRERENFDGGDRPHTIQLKRRLI